MIKSRKTKCVEFVARKKGNDICIQNFGRKIQSEDTPSDS